MKLFTAFVLLYLALDFGNPHVAGAHTFDASVEVVQQQRAPVAPAVSMASPPAARLAEPAAGPVAVRTPQPAPQLLAPIALRHVRPLAPPPDEDEA